MITTRRPGDVPIYCYACDRLIRIGRQWIVKAEGAFHLRLACLYVPAYRWKLHKRIHVMKELLLALVVAHGADSATTLMNLHGGNAEGNPLLPGRPVPNVVVCAALTAAQVEALRVLAPRKPRLARTIAIVALSVEAAAVGWNARAYRELGRAR
jgi:hypothetical protein